MYVSVEEAQNQVEVEEAFDDPLPDDEPDPFRRRESRVEQRGDAAVSDQQE